MPPPLTPAEQFRLTLEVRLLQLLALIDEWPAEGVRIESRFGRRVVSVRITPEGEDPAAPPPIRLTPCQRDCVETLRSAATPLTRVKLRAAMESAGKLWGESTVAKALADLVAARVLANDGHHQGYYIPE
jgi:hypothetical protein